MSVRSGFIATLTLLFGLAGCAAVAGEIGPTVHPVTGEEYPEGIPPRDTEYTTTATLFLVQAETADEDEAEGLYQRGLEQALEGIEAHPDNPQHYWLAGVAYAGLRDIERADEMWTRAQELYPAYEVEIDPNREAVWVDAFNRGIEAYNEGDLGAARRYWEEANLIYPKRPEGFQNLAAVYIQQGDEQAALEAYRGALRSLDEVPVREMEEEERQQREQAREEATFNLGQLLARAGEFDEAERLFRDYLERNPDDLAARSNLAIVLTQMGREAEAGAIYEELLADPDVGPREITGAGIALFQAEEFERAADAFRRVTDMNPYDRDAWYNYLNALYAQDAHEEVARVGTRLLEIDPANSNAMLIVARAYREMERSDRALEVLDRNEEMSVYVEDPQLEGGANRAVIRGTIEGNAAPEGSPITLRFWVFAGNRELGSETVTVSAPAVGERTAFDLSIPTSEPATGYRYELVD